MKISPAKGLEVVVPQGFDVKRLPGLLAAKEPWIHRTMARLQACNPVKPQDEPLPQGVELEAIGLSCRIVYRSEPGSGLSLDQCNQTQLVVSGDTDHRESVRALLRQWLLLKGRRFLVPWLDEVSRETGLTYGRVQIRRQTTRWGSCSRRGTVSLNCKLLFLPAPLVRYVLIHELCHTRHMNHSQRFWQEVARREPDCRALDHDLNQAWRLIPAWAH